MDIPCEVKLKIACSDVLRLKAERDAQFNCGFESGYQSGMERAAEIAETDTFAPPYGKRIADAIRAEIPEGNDE